MDIVHLGLGALGLFHAIAAILIMRAVVMDHLMDQMLAGITLQPIPFKEHLRRYLMVSTGLASGMGGVALLVLSTWAVPLFLIGLTAQAGYLLWAPGAFPIEDESDARGRRQTVNAAILYAAATFPCSPRVSMGICATGSTRGL
jgi:hypothetical protein